LSGRAVVLHLVVPGGEGAWATSMRWRGWPSPPVSSSAGPAPIRLLDFHLVSEPTVKGQTPASPPVQHPSRRQGTPDPPKPQLTGEEAHVQQGHDLGERRGVVPTTPRICQPGTHCTRHRSSRPRAGAHTGDTGPPAAPSDVPGDGRWPAGPRWLTTLRPGAPPRRPSQRAPPRSVVSGPLHHKHRSSRSSPAPGSGHRWRRRLPRDPSACSPLRDPSAGQQESGPCQPDAGSPGFVPRYSRRLPNARHPLRRHTKSRWRPTSARRRRRAPPRSRSRPLPPSTRYPPERT
jgi:hypothetical protein